MGLWVRLLRRDGKPHYLQHLPRTWHYLERNLRHAALHRSPRGMTRIPGYAEAGARSGEIEKSAQRARLGSGADF